VTRHDQAKPYLTLELLKIGPTSIAGLFSLSSQVRSNHEAMRSSNAATAAGLTGTSASPFCWREGEVVRCLSNATAEAVDV
jgi:hypothetical protein